MRVISGTLKGRKIHPPKLIHTRPTTDFGKTGLFNILNNHFNFEDVSFLDLFSGTGSLSYEFASRGCKRIVAVDADQHCVNFIRKMKEEWKLEGLEVIKSDVLRFIEFTREKFDIIFAGPPYALNEINLLPEKIFKNDLLKENGWFILETDQRYDFSAHPSFFRKTNYGQTTFHFFKK
ncbi:MAG: RsmD family RNA methyltransferase [Chitinophagales bacterium]